jgi:hypothetical protein
MSSVNGLALLVFPKLSLYFYPIYKYVIKNYHLLYFLKRFHFFEPARFLPIFFIKIFIIIGRN